MNAFTKGTSGYRQAISRFAAASLSLEFTDINAEFLPFLPAPPARVLDAGSGVGQNAAALSKLGYSVTAVEPIKEFVDIARSAFSALPITWIVDELPDLGKMTDDVNRFDMILLDGVWHHLDHSERHKCIVRFRQLLGPGGVCAISLRNGPAGVGTHVFPTCCDELESLAKSNGFSVGFRGRTAASKMANKPGVTWSRMVLIKSGCQPV